MSDECINPEKLNLGQEIEVYFYGSHHTVKVKSISYEMIGFMLFEGTASEHHISIRKIDWNIIKIK